MSSYTSSSDRGFIIKAVATMLLVFAAYGFLTPKLFPNGGGAQNQWQDNIIKAQKYIYEKRDIPYVVAGSSLSARIALSFLPKDYYNLSFSGGSVLTGLEVIIKSDKTPKVVLIETNVIMRASDKKFLYSLFNPGMHLMRTYLPMTKDQFQPMAVFGTPIVQMLLTSAGFFGENENAGIKQQQNKAFDIGLKRQQESFSKPPNAEILNERIESFKRSVATLQKRGVKVVFFEMPIHPSLYGTPQTIIIKKALLNTFPADKYDWIPSPAPADYHTTDGMHLNNESAHRYSNFLITEFQRITEKRSSFSEI